VKLLTICGILKFKNALDKATEELQRMARKREELEIALEQAKVYLSKAKHFMDDRVSQLVVECDELQKILKSACENSRPRPSRFKSSWTKRSQTKGTYVPLSKRNSESL
jgi:hypothetical protein